VLIRDGLLESTTSPLDARDREESNTHTPDSRVRSPGALFPSP